MFSCLSDFYQFPFADSSPPPPPKESVFSVSWLSGCFSSSSISFNPSLPFNSQGYYMCFQDFTFHSFNKYSLNKYLWLTFSHSYTHVQTTKFCWLYNQKLILKLTFFYWYQPSWNHHHLLDYCIRIQTDLPTWWFIFPPISLSLVSLSVCNPFQNLHAVLSLLCL